MLRPERMSRVSVTGSKRVMDDVIEAVHDLDLLHLSDYTNEIEGFEPGNPLEGADEYSEKLVTVRALKSTLGIEDDYEGPTHVVTDEDLEDELEDVRQEVNALDDRHEEARSELRSIREDIEQLEFFVQLGIDLDLLGGYDSLEVAVGEGDPETVTAALEESEIETFDVTAEGEAIAVFAHVDDPGALEDALVSATFSEVPIPDATGDPAEYLKDRRHRKQQLESKLSTVEDELEDLKLKVGGFLLAAEEKLTIAVQKREAPLSFATTDNAFVAEGWLPTAEVDTLRDAVETAADGTVEVEELEQADYDENGHPVHSEDVEDESGDGPPEPSGSREPDRTDGPVARERAEEESERTAADGGYVPLGKDSPPTVQDNPEGIKPFEALVEVINRPKYTELDPTVILFLTFPTFFGFMIGDLGYGLLYMGLGYWLMTSFDSDVIASLGGIALWAGGFTALFGILYGEIFGLHQLGEFVWNGHPPIHKGLQPEYIRFAKAWLLISIIVGVLHLVVGRVFDLFNNLHHGVREAFLESGPWILMTVGIWLWVFSTHISGPKPDFMFEVFNTGSEAAFKLGFAGFSETVGFVGLGMLAVGFVLGVVAEGGIVIIESITQVFGHVISYTRLAAVLLAKAGMALAVNLLVFGAYKHDGAFHFIFFQGMPEETEWIIFSGLVNADGAAALVLGVLAGIVILLLGHLLVLLLGVTSAGLQSIRLEYVEFFGKFYEGGGAVYNPFGHDRNYTVEE
ncbi:V-type ATPase 116kDa subunit family protein [Halapricum hydrolyticum]|uniref:A-type ATP synthase subunit I n=1 Tax=Halapricum hydrolyticum TaxID=2979991 RepID=A0AAE3IC01_9EURY|nr:V-type ATPase 116kDa subunit family protein [Halapricum hydrolyticum]MCU4717850.1 V-type ATP synthase subunit I [Halapricum hydrolyticum]MCU4727014.1 V-type ATP synthase subunit I [Halapricum hydrolyticum]